MLALLAAGCGAPPAAPEVSADGGRDVEVPHGDETPDPGGEAEAWWLVSATPDGRLLELTSTGGGCSHFQGWVTDADDEQVAVEARWEHTEEDVCNAMLQAPSVVLDLGEPLGGRTLSGCGHDDCLELPEDRDVPGAFAGRLTVIDGMAVVASHREVWGVAPDGELTWRTPPAEGWVETVGEWFLRFDHDRRIEARGADGEVAWERDGVTLAGVVGDTLVVCPREQAGEAGARERFLGGLDAATGEWRWRLDDEPCTTDGVTGATGTAGAGHFARIEYDGEGTWLDVRETATGERLHRLRITEPEASISTPTWLDADRVAVSSFDGELWVVRLASGAVERRDGIAGRIEAVVDGVPIVVGETRVQGLSDDASEVRWEIPRAGDGAFLVVGDSAVVRFDPATATVVSIDPATGTDRWAADLGFGAAHVAVAADGDRALVATSRALFAFDASSGEQRWWIGLPPADAQPVTRW